MRHAYGCTEGPLTVQTPNDSAAPGRSELAREQTPCTHGTPANPVLVSGNTNHATARGYGWSHARRSQRPEQPSAKPAQVVRVLRVRSAFQSGLLMARRARSYAAYGCLLRADTCSRTTNWARRCSPRLTRISPTRGKVSGGTIIYAPNSTQTPAAGETGRCTRRRRATSGTSG